MLSVSSSNTVKITVRDEDTAAAVKSGSLPVLATPRLAALMEQAASELFDASAEPGITSVGVRLELDHLAPSVVGEQVDVRCEVTDLSEKKITFSLIAHGSDGRVLARGVHVRCPVNAQRFMQKARGGR